MKKNIFIITILFLYCSNIQKIYSQQYTPIVSSGNISSWSLPFLTMASTHIDSIYTIEVENGYFELWYIHKYAGYPNGYQGKIRPDQDNALLYMITHDSEEEKLIMSLNLEVGDEFEFTDFSGNPFLAKVDAVYEEFGLKHIQFNYGIEMPGTYHPKLTFIEGVGPNWGFCCQVIPYFFMCKYNNQELFYSLEAEYVKDCKLELPWSVNDFNTEHLINVYPNPTINNVTISSNIKYPLTNLCIINFLGQTMYECSFESNLINLDTSNWQSGVYVIQCMVKNNSINFKFIKL